MNREEDTVRRRFLYALAAMLSVVSAAAGQEIAGFTLMDARTDREIRPLQDGDLIDVAKDGPQWTIRADVGGKVGSVRFGLNENEARRTESVAPYSLQGDDKGDFHAWTPSPGEYRVTAVAFSGPGGSGEAGPGRDDRRHGCRNARRLRRRQICAPVGRHRGR
jgi:hypothetical protein